MNTLVRQYQQAPITFKIGEDLMVNATEMAKAFGKIPGKWLELPSSKDFIHVLRQIREREEIKGASLITQMALQTKNADRFIKTIEGRNGGTWFHVDVALEFARWLSPAFGIWCNDQVLAILTGGIAVLRESTPSGPMDRLTDSILALTDAIRSNGIASQIIARSETIRLDDSSESLDNHSNVLNTIKKLEAADKKVIAAPLQRHWQAITADQKERFAKKAGMAKSTIRSYARGEGSSLTTLNRLLSLIP